MRSLREIEGKINETLTTTKSHVQSHFNQLKHLVT